MIRNWIGLDNNIQVGQSILHDIGWIAVLVKKHSDQNTNVGVNAEYEPDVTSFEIRARIDKMAEQDGKDQWIGLVEDHILPMMSKGDHWVVQHPNEAVVTYKVISVERDEIMLERL